MHVDDDTESSDDAYQSSQEMDCSVHSTQDTCQSNDATADSATEVAAAAAEHLANEEADRIMLNFYRDLEELQVKFPDRFLTVPQGVALTFTNNFLCKLDFIEPRTPYVKERIRECNAVTDEIYNGEYYVRPISNSTQVQKRKRPAHIPKPANVPRPLYFQIMRYHHQNFSMTTGLRSLHGITALFHPAR